MMLLLQGYQSSTVTAPGRVVAVVAVVVQVVRAAMLTPMRMLTGSRRARVDVGATRAPRVENAPGVNQGLRGNGHRRTAVVVGMTATGGRWGMPMGTLWTAQRPAWHRYAGGRACIVAHV